MPTTPPNRNDDTVRITLRGGGGVGRGGSGAVGNNLNANNLNADFLTSYITDDITDVVNGRIRPVNPNNNGAVAPSSNPSDVPTACHGCNNLYRRLHVREHPTIQNVFLCPDCFNDAFCECGNCGEITENSESHYTETHNSVCHSCYEDSFFACERCNNNYHNDCLAEHEDYETICERCAQRLEQAESGNGYRDYDTSDSFTVKGQRPYSAEIECYFDNGKDIPKPVGIIHDGSLVSFSNGKEIVTPKLSGEVGDNILKETCEALKDIKAVVDKSCGLHIHIDTTDLMLDTAKVRNLVMFYMMFEPVLYSFLPISRRTNKYCLPLTDFYHSHEIMNVGSLKNLELIWYREQNYRVVEQIKRGSKYEAKRNRYSGINFDSLFHNGHIEIRYHSGTIDYNKIRMWIDLHLAIINTIAEGNYSLNKILEVRYLVSLEEKQRTFFEILKLPLKTLEYFLDRQKKFAVVSDKNKNICAE